MKTYIGKVISDKANKTILVAVDRWMIVPKYKKKIKRTSKFMAHDENNDCRMGDIVTSNVDLINSSEANLRLCRGQETGIVAHQWSQIHWHGMIEVLAAASEEYRRPLLSSKFEPLLLLTYSDQILTQLFTEYLM
ncbi:hypothetical protein WJX75_002948 [Coccomyxa subellipsoidea]|uniref:Uncharacterized protein n=1 Tax=Coccomyxa subellipsoidea TaxID=248742 RepID=A0ABR2YXX7_9CHLO